MIKYGCTNTAFSNAIREAFPRMRLVMCVRQPKGSIGSHMQVWQSKQIELYVRKQRQEHL